MSLERFPNERDLHVGAELKGVEVTFCDSLGEVMCATVMGECCRNIGGVAKATFEAVVSLSLTKQTKELELSSVLWWQYPQNSS